MSISAPQREISRNTDPPREWETEILVVQVAERLFGIPSRVVREVTRAATLTPMPRPHPFIEGELNVRGHALPVVDLRRLFDLPNREIGINDHLIIVADDVQPLALRVDSAIGLLRLDSNQIDAADSRVLRTPLVTRLAKTTLGIVYLIEMQELLEQ
jgi:purine-binding chemotaxis protein CheW